MAADENVRESFDIPVLDIDGKRVKLHRSVQHTASQLRVPCVCVCVCVCASGTDGSLLTLVF